MPAPVALFLTLGFIGFLFRRDFRERSPVTGALWLPLLWMLIMCSRPVSTWLNMFGLPVTGAVSEEEGSPLDAVVYFVLIASGVLVLNQRRISVAEVMRDNAWLTLFLAYCFLAIFWSDFPVVSFKRWIKVLGHPIMVLVLFTEPNFRQALAVMMKRCAYVLLPVSILFIKYYPGWGRKFSRWTGAPENTGITTNKNTLGSVCMVLAFFLIWHLLQTLRGRRSRARRNELLLCGGLLAMIAYLLRAAQSSTCWACVLLFLVIVVVLGMRRLDKRLIGTYAVGALMLLAIAEWAFGISGMIIQLLNRDPTLTGRTEVWQMLLKMDTSPLFGTGFESFWLGTRLQTIASAYWWHPSESHNGYLEIYLDLGIVGLLVFIGLLFATFRKCRMSLLIDPEWGRFRVGVLAAIIAYNLTEAEFKGVSVPFFIFFLVAMDYASRHIGRFERSAEPLVSEHILETNSAK